MASPDLAFARLGLPAFPTESGRTPRRQPAAACDQRGPAFLGAPACHWLRRTKFHGGRAVCAASHQRRIGGLDCRTQEPTEHVVFPARVGRISLVCARTAGWPVRGGRILVCAWVAGQAASDYIPIRSTVVGLLAFAPDVCI